MKQFKTTLAALLSLLLIFSLGACGDQDLSAGGNGAASTPQSTVSSSPPGLESSQPSSTFSPVEASAVTAEIKICTVDGNSVRGVGLTEAYHEVYDFSCAPEQLNGADALLPGMVVEIGFDGTVLETWPAQIHAETVTFKEQQTDYYSLYLQILEDIYGEDDGLNSGADYFGFDFTEIEHLSESEKSLLAWNFSTSHGAEPIMGTLRELMDDGTINEEELYWEDGLHFTVKEKEVKDNTVSYSVEKWKGGLGAMGYENSADLAPDGQWVFSKISTMWIA